MDGAIVGVALGVIGTAGLYCVNKMSKDKSANSATAYVGLAAVGYGLYYGAAAGAIYGLGKTILG